MPDNMCLPVRPADNLSAKKSKPAAKVIKTEPATASVSDDERSNDEDTASSSSADNGSAHQCGSSSVATDTSSGTHTSMQDAVERGVMPASSNYMSRTK